jgi:hypothetical protein
MLRRARTMTTRLDTEHPSLAALLRDAAALERSIRVAIG